MKRVIVAGALALTTVTGALVGLTGAAGAATPPLDCNQPGAMMIAPPLNIPTPVLVSLNLGGQNNDGVIAQACVWTNTTAPSVTVTVGNDAGGPYISLANPA